ncbi:hypothetical protein B0H11DRAFT_1984751 [Mycena galericulata]|nr:hypothetical protein B0H11DRAFT_1984751 [Mycena galericulata]
MAAATSTSAFTADVRLFHSWTPLVPERQAVVRKDPDYTVVPIATTSEYIWVLPAAQGLLASISYFPIMIRQEYDDLLMAVLSSLDRQQRELRDDRAGVPLIPPPKEEADDSRMDVDGQAVTPRIKEESVKPDRTAALQLRIVQRRISDLETYPNPFQLPEYRGLYNAAGAIIVTGLPGIGKTCFLRQLFHLRVAAGLPTLYMSNDRSATLYKNGQLGELKMPTTMELMENLPTETWCLVDSNVNFPTVPGEVQDTGLFIVQASSPRANTMEYSKKIHGRSQFCLMSPWTLSELIAGYSLQPLVHTPEQNIKAFYERFGGSARNVFRRFDDSDAFEAEIDAVAATLSAKDIERVFLSDVTRLNVPDHMLLSAFPVTDDDRRQFQIRSPSTAMYAKVLKRLHASDNEARLRLYRICVGVKTAGCRAWAADLFDQHFHDFLSIGGTWPLHTIEQSAGTRMGAARRRWTGRTEESGSFLKADKEMSIVTTGDQPQQPATVSRVTFDEANEPGVGSPLSPGVYYRPTRKNFATFDSFYIDNPGHALAFQASRAQEHDVKEEGLKWLEDRGITKITYIYVTPANSEGCPNLKVPVARENMFDFFYHMRL